MDLEEKQKNRILTFGELAFISFLTLLAMFIINIGLIKDAIFRSNNLPSDYYYQEVGNLQDRIPDFLYNILFSPSIGTFLLWGALGLLVYLIMISFQEEVGTLVSKIQVSVSYTHPKQFKQFTFWVRAILELLFPFVTLAGLLAWTWLCLTVLIPFSSVQVLIILNDYSSIIDTVFRFLYSFVSLGLVGVGYIVIMRTFSLLRTVIY